MNIFVSIILPNFNSSATIQSTLNSIKAQTFENYECLIIDDKSTDNSIKIIKRVIKNDNRFKIIESKINKGVSKTRNIGLANAKGRFITFIDSDDIWGKDFLSNNIELRKGKNIPISHSPYIRFKKTNQNNLEGALVNPPILIDKQNILIKNYLPLLAVFIDRDLVGPIKFRETRPEDYDLWIDLIKFNNFYSLSTLKISSFYRISNEQRSKNKWKAFIRINKFYERKLNINKFISLIYSLRWMYMNIIQRFSPYKDLRKYKISPEIYSLLNNE